MTNPPPAPPKRPLRETRSMGELRLVDVPRVRILAWLLVAAVTVAGIVLYFLYGDAINPVLVLRDMTSVPSLSA